MENLSKAKSKEAAKAGKRKPGRPRASQASSAEDPRTRLLKFAIKIFSQYGYDAVSTGDVARAADLSQPMVHYHFGSKEQLWKAAMDYLMRDLGRRFPTSSSELKDLDPIGRLKVITRRFILMSAQDSTLTKIIIHESLAQGERLKWLVRTYVRRGFGEFDSVIEDGVKDGLIKDIPVYLLANTIVTASSFTFCFKALVSEAYDVDISKPERIQEMSDGITEILFHGLVKKT